MSITPQQFVAKYNNKYVQWRECVALFWQYNEDCNVSENYAAVGAINLWTNNSWTSYTPITSSPRYGDWAIWSGSYGAYTNTGYGHVAMFISDNGNGTGRFFSQNPNPAQIINLSYSGLVGYLRPKNIVSSAADNISVILAPNERRVGEANLNQRNKSTTDSRVIRVINANTVEKFTGYVHGQPVAGNDVWFKDAKGYVWSGGFDGGAKTKGLKNLTPLKAHQRKVGNANVNQRNKATTDSKIVRLIKANTVENFTGYVEGEKIAGNNIWFADAKGYVWSGAFDDPSHKGLKNLTPEPEPQPKPKPEIATNERRVGTGNVNHRVQPSTDAVVLRLIDANSLEVFTGYVHGQPVDGNDIWFKDVKGFAWSGAFLDPSTDGLKDLTHTLDELPPLDAAYEFTPDFDFVEYIPADTTNMQHGSFPAKPTHLILHQFNKKEINPSVEGVIAHFQQVRPGSESSAHFVVSGTRIIQMVSLNDRAYHGYTIGNDYIGIEVDPAMDAETIVSVKKLLLAIENKYGYMPTWIKHKDVPECDTACGYQLDYSKFKDSEPEPPVIPTPKPEPKPEPTPTPEPEPTPEDDQELIRLLEQILTILKNRQ